MSKSTVHQIEDGTFKVEEVSEIPERLRYRGLIGKWIWLRKRVVELVSKDDRVLRVECPNRMAMTRAQSAIQNVSKRSRRQPRLPEGYKVRTRSEQAPGQLNGVYHLYVEVVEAEEQA